MESIIAINNKEYPLAATLRVAYLVQGQNDHKPYIEVFRGIESMPLERQIGILYMSFKVANPEDAKTITNQQFLDYFLDNYDLKELMSMLEFVVNGIMGRGEEQPVGDIADNEGN